MKAYWWFRKLFFLVIFLAIYDSGLLKAQDKSLATRLSTAVGNFTGSLDAAQKKEASVLFTDSLRFDWNYVPRERKGLSLKNMNMDQQEKAFAMVRVVLSAGGYQKTREIIDLENVLRVIENKSASDTYRDPTNYSFLIFGESGGKEPWGWRLEGHHISLHFTVAGDEITFTPGFLGSNPGTVLAEVPQKGKRILKEEQDLAFQLLHSFSAAQQRTLILSEKAPWEILSTNKRSHMIKLKPEGMAMKNMTTAQKTLFQKLIAVYLDRYHVTLKNQQMNKLKKTGLDGIHFAWMGNTDPEIKKGAGYYYRIQGPSILIELDNTQNDGNHIHTVVRDLTNDFGEDLLRTHYEKMHVKH
jgi:hypothetical protein